MQRFIPQESSKLINLIGRGADKPVPFQNAYSSSKMWVRSFSKSLAQEYKSSGVGVYILIPALVLTDMTTEVEAIEGYVSRLSVFNTILRMWGNLPEVTARKAVQLASSATNGKTGLEISVLTPGLLVRGVLGELKRRLMRQPNTLKEIKVTEIPSAVPAGAANRPGPNKPSSVRG